MADDMLYAGGSKNFDEKTGTYIDPAPVLPESEPYSSKNSTAIKAATPDVILFDDASLPIESLTSLIFENIGGQEIINMVRSDTIDGTHVDYSPISNLKNLSALYSSKNIINVSGGLEQYFKNFAIRLDIHIPERGTGPLGSSVYIDRLNQDPIQKNRLVVDVVNMKTNEQVDIQVLNSGVYLDGIIDTTEES